MATWHATFLFAGEGLYIRGDAMGLTREYSRGDRTVIVSLPTEEETHPGFPERQGREGRATTYREDPREYIAISVLRFEVAVVVTAHDEPDQATIYQETFPIASEVAEEFLAWVRAGANQPWLPARHEGVRRDGVPALINAETGAVAEPRLSWNPPLTVLGIPDEAAASATQLAEIFDRLASGDSPTTAETLLSNARAALFPPSVMDAGHHDRADTAYAVLLAAVACEVQIKSTMRDRVSAEMRPLVDIILDSPRDVSVAAGQLLDKPMRAATGRSLRDDDKPLFVAVTETLFPLRNKVAHHGYSPGMTEAREAVTAAEALFRWLATVQAT